jgi:hypothetical protein
MLPRARNSELTVRRNAQVVLLAVAAKVSVRFLPTLDIKSRHIAVRLKTPIRPTEDIFTVTLWVMVR